MQVSPIREARRIAGADRDESLQDRWLLCRAGAVLCALPLTPVIETMRPRHIEPIGSAPAYIAGLAIIRGAPVPIVDLALLLGHAAAAPRRLVTIRIGARTVGLAVEAVLDVRRFDDTTGSEPLPPLLKELAGDVVAAVGRLDAELMLFLDTARLVPESVLASLEPEAAR